MSDSVVAIVETAATGEIAELYADIRATLGVPVVNLIWRHLATMGGALPWAWSAVRPLYVSGAIEGEAERFRAAMSLPPVGRLPADVLTGAGLDEGALESIRGVLASYDRSNTMNLIALAALSARASGDAAAGGKIAVRPVANPIKVPLPRLLSKVDVAASTWSLVSRLNGLGERDDGRVVASMYRHLAHWPAFLALVWTSLDAAAGAGELDDAIAANLATARARARVVARDVAMPEAAPPSSALAMAAVRMFVDHPIGKMVTICRAIRGALG